MLMTINKKSAELHHLPECLVQKSHFSVCYLEHKVVDRLSANKHVKQHSLINTADFCISFDKSNRNFLSLYKFLM